MSEVAQIIAQAGGSATRQELRPALRGRPLTRAVRSGEILRVRRGIYTLPALDASLEAGLRTNGVVSHRSAALLHGWGVLHAPKQPELTIPRHRRVEAGRRRQVHARWRTLDPQDMDDSCTTPLRTVVDCAADLPLPESLAVADSALRSGKVTAQELADATVPRIGRSRAGRALALASAEAANPFESGLRAFAVEATDGVWTPQQPITLRDGVVLHADVGCAAVRVALEADSHEFHKSRSDIIRDCHRYNEMTIAGWVVLRFAWEHVMFHPDWVREVIAWVVAVRSAHKDCTSIPA